MRPVLDFIGLAHTFSLCPALMKNGGLLNTCSICRFKRQKQSTLPSFVQISDISGYTKQGRRKDFKSTGAKIGPQIPMSAKKWV